MARAVLMASILGVGAALAFGPTPGAAPLPPPTPVHAEGLHNVYRLAPNLFSGGGPEGAAGIESLRRLGVRTVISVDGAVPDVATTEAHGMRSVHLPIGYDGIPRDRALLLAKAVRDLPGPVYLHCHHGKHRGPSAAACVLLALDRRFTAKEAGEWLALAGTDPRYRGLTTLPHTFRPPTPQEFAATPSRFPSATPPADLTHAMVRIDEHWDRVKAWRPGKSAIAPPLDAAVQLGELYREAARHPRSIALGGEFLRQLRNAETAAADLENGMRTRDESAIKGGIERSQAACSRCHAKFRD